MKFIKTFNEHSDYQEFINGGGVAFPNVSHCKAENDTHYTPFRALKFTADGKQTISLVTNGTAAPNLEYSVDNGKTWNTWDYSAVSFGGGRDFYLRGNNPKGLSTSTSNYVNFAFGDSGVTVECHGNIMHLLSYESDLTEGKFMGYLFKDCTTLTVAPELPAVSIPSLGYVAMFSGCTSLVEAPELPATTFVGQNNYESMFKGCTSLTKAPSILPAITLRVAIYSEMFEGCISLTTAPELPATQLESYCYQRMFGGCTSLVNAPSILPATTLKTACYIYMFIGCTSLTVAPILPAESLSASSCYGLMFNGCSSLNYVKCLATSDITASACNAWLRNVPSTGTFVKKAGVEWQSGISGIPTGWTVEEV